MWQLFGMSTRAEEPPPQKEIQGGSQEIPKPGEPAIIPPIANSPHCFLGQSAAQVCGSLPFGPDPAALFERGENGQQEHQQEKKEPG